MSHTQLILCLFGISAVFFNNVEAYRVRRIIGGKSSKKSQFPYQVSLEVEGINGCGGSILSESFVLTAAHCVIDKDNDFMQFPTKVVAGTLDLKSSSRVVVNVAKVFVSKDFDVRNDTQTSRSIADIAVLKLSEDLDLEGNPKLGRVLLPMRDVTYEGVEAIVSGFGLNYIEVHVDSNTSHSEEVNGRGDGKMRDAVATVLSNDKCVELYGSTLLLEKSHLCAAVEQHDKAKPEGVCKGDSGGPLVYEGVQIGVVSASPTGCKEDRVPAVYTKVFEYVDFINNVVKGRIDKNIRTTAL